MKRKRKAARAKDFWTIGSRQKLHQHLVFSHSRPMTKFIDTALSNHNYRLLCMTTFSNDRLSSAQNSWVARSAAYGETSL